MTLFADTTAAKSRNFQSFPPNEPPRIYRAKLTTCRGNNRIEEPVAARGETDRPLIDLSIKRIVSRIFPVLGIRVTRFHFFFFFEIYHRSA